jgi:feruloyl esterase
LILSTDLQSSGLPVPFNVIDYYETVEKTMGGRAATQTFTRLFALPGRDHCGGGPGANAIDFLSALEAWVELGRAPDQLIGYHLDEEDTKSGADWTRVPKDPGKSKFTRPIYPYPIQARYQGRGDPNDWRSFKAADVSR